MLPTFAGGSGALSSIIVGGTVFSVAPTQFVNDLKIDKLGLANKLTWYNNETFTSSLSIGTISLYKTTMDKITREYMENNYTTVFEDISNNYSSINTYIDRDISLNTFYKYKFTVPKWTGNSISGVNEYYGTTQSFYESPINTNVLFDYDIESFIIKWDHIDYLYKDSYNNMDEKSWLSYYIWIEEVLDTSNNLVYYETTAPTSIIDSQIREDSNTITISNSTVRKGGDSNVDINLSKYNFYITPTFYQDVSGSTFPGNIEDINLSLNDDYVNHRAIYSMQNASYTIIAPSPKNLRITSSYNNGKISFEWDEASDASSYIIKITNTDEPIGTSLLGSRYYENPRQITVNTNKYTMDNTDLSIKEAYSPGNYSIVVVAKYNTLTSINSNAVTLAIPITPINLEVKFIGQDNVTITNNLVNGVKRAQLTWNQFGYATLYKLQIHQYDNEGVERETLTYYNHPNNYNKFFNKDLDWDYNPNKARFTCKVSYTIDHNIYNGVPTSSSNELGEQWLV